MARADDSQRLANFMGYFNSKLAREVGRLTGWRDKIFARRYQAILVSEEEEAQVGRLLYLLSHGAKENLVADLREWPGVHCVDALLTGESLEGTWFDRTEEYTARQRGGEFGAREYSSAETVALTPLPCWADLSPEEYKARIADLLEAIVTGAANRRSATGIQPLGRAAILSQHPFSQPTKTKKSPAPLVHAASKRVRTEIKIAYAWFVRVFREAAEYLRAGDRLARFPKGSFPPGLPFVRAAVGPAG
ncbi:MAG: hypothetical protein ABJC13_03490 [Acidobacteriota bacterium]